MTTAPVIQQYVNDAFAAQLAADAAALAAKDVIIANLNAQIANIPPPPVPTQWNTGVRGGLAQIPGGYTTAHDITYSNKANYGAGATISGANVTMQNCKFTITTTNGLVVTGAGFVMSEGQVDKKVTGAGTFTNCNLASLELTGPSVVKNCYIPGGITGPGATDPATVLSNNTLTP